MSTLVTLTGYLGKHRDVRHTRERTRIAKQWNSVAEMTEEYEVTHQPRPYIILSLATHDHGRTTWHRLVAWSPERNGLSHMRLARKGDRVQVSGRRETFTFPGANGSPHSLEQVVVTSFRLLRPKIRREVP